MVAGGGIFTYAGPSRFSHQRSGSSPSAVAAAGGLVASDGSGTAARGLAAALAALPGGSPMRRGSSTGIELSDAAAFGSGMVTAGPELGPDASGASTPASEAGGGRVQRPLLYQQALRSSDRLPADSPDQRPPRPEQYRGSLPPLPPAVAVAAPEQPAAEGVHQQPQQGGGAADTEPTFSLSFSRGSGLADIGSISLNGSGSQSDDCADTAASQHGAGAGAAAVQTPNGASPAEPAAAAPSVEPSGSSSRTLLALGQQADSAAAQPGDSSPPPSGAMTRSGGSAAALLPLVQGGEGGSSSSPTSDTLPVRPRHAPTSSVEVAAALGYDQAPPNAEEIYAAILSRSRAAGGGGGGGLAAVYGGKAERQGGGEGEGSEGIATRWWTTYQRERLAGPARAFTSARVLLRALRIVLHVAASCGRCPLRGRAAPTCPISLLLAPCTLCTAPHRTRAGSLPRVAAGSCACPALPPPRP